MKPTPVLPHMPWLIKKKIVDAANFDTKMALTICSKDYHQLVKSSPVEHKKLFIRLCKYCGFIELTLENHRVLRLDYQSINNDLLIENDQADWGKLVLNRNLVEEMFSQFVKYTQNPKISLEMLSVEFACDHEHAILFLNLLDQVASPQKVAVKYVMLRGIRQQGAVVSVLSHLQPGKIKEIMLTDRLSKESLELADVIELEQWRQCESLVSPSTTLPITTWNHFSFVFMTVRVAKTGFLKSIFKNLLENANIKSHAFQFQRHYERVQKYLEKFEFNAERNFWIVPIPNSRDWLKCEEHMRNAIKVTRMRR